jgi:hypothetical protein
MDAVEESPINQASIYINGVFQGRTASDGSYYLIHSGNDDFQIKATKDGYIDVTSSVLKNQSQITLNMTRKNLNLAITLFDSDSLATISGATVTVTGGNETVSKTTNQYGLITFDVISGYQYTVEIAAPNYHPRTETVAIDVNNKEVQYWLLRSDRFSFLIKNKNDMSPVQGAEVSVDGTVVGQSDENGVVTTQIARGKEYSIEVNKQGFVPLIQSKVISSSDAVLLIPITPAPFNIFISVFDESKTPVSGASVYIGGVLKGETDQYGRLALSDVAGGTYQLEVRHSGFASKSQQIDVNQNGQDFTVELGYDLADVTIFVQDNGKKVIPGAQIQVNNQVIGSTDENGQITTKLKVNTNYTISAQKEGYQTTKTEKTILPGSTSSTVTIAMEQNLDLTFVGLLIAGVIVVIVVFAAIRFMGRRGPRRPSHRGGL